MGTVPPLIWDAGRFLKTDLGVAEFLSFLLVSGIRSFLHILSELRIHWSFAVSNAWNHAWRLFCVALHLLPRLASGDVFSKPHGYNKQCQHCFFLSFIIPYSAYFISISQPLSPANNWFSVIVVVWTTVMSRVPQATTLRRARLDVRVEWDVL